MKIAVFEAEEWEHGAFGRLRADNEVVIYRAA